MPCWARSVENEENHQPSDTFQLHHAVDNMYKTIRFILEFSAEHRDYNNTLYYNHII